MADRHSLDCLDALDGLAHAVNKGMTRELAPYGLILMEFRLLRYCQQQDGCTVTQLARILPADPSHVSRVVQGLMDRDLLRRHRLRSDRRVVMLSLSEGGRELLSRVVENVSHYEGMLTEGVSDEELRILIAVSRRIIDNHAATQEAD